jgi:hypothetical protein
MDLYIAVSIFIVANSLYFYNLGKKQGLTEGKFTGMISIVQFLKEKNVLKDKKDITGYERWPEAIKVLYVTANPDLFED